MKKYQNGEYNPQTSDSDTHFKALHSELSYSRTLDDFTQRIQKIIGDIGFSDFMFIRLNRLWLDDSRHGLLHSFPDELMRIYHERKIYETDLILLYGKDNTQPIFSSEVYDYIDKAPFEIGLVKKNRTLLQLYRRFGYFEHYVIPIPALNGSGNVQLLLTRNGIDKKKFQSLAEPVLHSCRSLCKAIDSVSTTRFRSSFIDSENNPVSITRKPLHILHQLANTDMNIKEPASEMSISPITAHQHIATARKVLRVKTNIAAVTKAIKSGLITLDE